MKLCKHSSSSSREETTLTFSSPAELSKVVELTMALSFRPPHGRACLQLLCCEYSSIEMNWTIFGWIFWNCSRGGWIGRGDPDFRVSRSGPESLWRCGHWATPAQCLFNMLWPNPCRMQTGKKKNLNEAIHTVQSQYYRSVDSLISSHRLRGPDGPISQTRPDKGLPVNARYMLFGS